TLAAASPPTMAVIWLLSSPLTSSSPKNTPAAQMIIIRSPGMAKIAYYELTALSRKGSAAIHLFGVPTNIFVMCLILNFPMMRILSLVYAELEKQYLSHDKKGMDHHVLYIKSCNFNICRFYFSKSFNPLIVFIKNTLIMDRKTELEVLIERF